VMQHTITTTAAGMATASGATMRIAGARE